jgi:hypothetical protein
MNLQVPQATAARNGCGWIKTSKAGEYLCTALKKSASFEFFSGTLASGDEAKAWISFSDGQCWRSPVSTPFFSGLRRFRASYQPQQGGP